MYSSKNPLITNINAIDRMKENHWPQASIRTCKSFFEIQFFTRFFIDVLWLKRFSLLQKVYVIVLYPRNN